MFWFFLIIYVTFGVFIGLDWVWLPLVQLCSIGKCGTRLWSAWWSQLIEIQHFWIASHVCEYFWEGPLQGEARVVSYIYLSPYIFACTFPYIMSVIGAYHFVLIFMYKNR